MLKVSEYLLFLARFCNTFAKPIYSSRTFHILLLEYIVQIIMFWFYNLHFGIFLRPGIYRMHFIDSSMIMCYDLWEIHFSKNVILVESFILMSLAWSLRHCKSMSLSMIHSKLLWFPSFTRNHDTHCTFNVVLKNFGY